MSIIIYCKLVCLLLLPTFVMLVLCEVPVGATKKTHIFGSIASRSPQQKLLSWIFGFCKLELPVKISQQRSMSQQQTRSNLFLLPLLIVIVCDRSGLLFFVSWLILSHLVLKLVCRLAASNSTHHLQVAKEVMAKCSPTEPKTRPRIAKPWGHGYTLDETWSSLPAKPYNAFRQMS